MLRLACRVRYPKGQLPPRILPVIRYRSIKAAKHTDKLPADSAAQKPSFDQRKPQTLKNSETIKDATQKIIGKSKPQIYTDLENQGLDLSLDNKTLVANITKNLKYRMQQRIEKMSKKWEQKFHQIVNAMPARVFKGYKGSKGDIIKEQFRNCFQNVRMSADKVGQPVSVGDLVVIQEGSSEFFLIASCPESLDANYYTFINNKGKIVFGTSSKIKFRIPSFLPDHLLPVVESMVMLEDKTLNVPPIGVVDNDMTKSEAAKPKELEGKPVTSKLEDPETTQMEGQEDDFIASQSSSKLLINSDVNTYVVPANARNMYSQLLSTLSIESMAKFKDFSTKLELVHRALQYEENGDVMGSSRIISIFQIVHLLEKLHLGRQSGIYDSLTKSNIDKIRKLLKFDQFADSSSSTLGKVILGDTDVKSIEHIERSQFKLALYFATILQLRKQTRLWKINEQNSVNPVTSIVVLPISYKEKIDNLTNYLKSNHNEIVSFIIERMTKKDFNLAPPEYYESVIELFKDFISGNLRNDFELETWCTKLIRMIDSSMPVNYEYTYEYGKLKAYDILQTLGEIKYDNPANWSWALEQDTFRNKLNKEYFTLVDTYGQKVSDSDFYAEDPMQGHRTEFTEPVFCIDSETAHEIDDGISIVDNGNNYTVSIHIANPSSYLKPTSLLSQIAFGSGSTTYLPEGPIKMLPEYVSDLSGLGIDGQSTRSFGIFFDVPHNFSDLPLAKVMETIATSSRIKFCNVSNFPKGYTYEYVNQVLEGEVEDKYSSKLNLLHQLSQTLKDIRVKQGNARNIDHKNSEMKVTKLTEAQAESQFTANESGYSLAIEDLEISLNQAKESGKSVNLVTEMMIIGNHLTSVIGKRLNIPLIFRNQVMNLSKGIIEQMLVLDPTNFTDRLRFIKVMNSAKLDIINRGHESLGLSSYSQITSPLRRFTDMINQWMFQAAFNNEELKIGLNNAVNHLQAKEMITKQLDRVSDRFYKGVFLRELLNKSSFEHEMRFKIHHDKIKSKSEIENFTNFKTTIETDNGFDNDEISSKDVSLSRIDFIENELILKLNS